jgi:hypothetical protein
MKNQSTSRIAGVVMAVAFWLPQQLLAQNTIMVADQSAQTDAQAAAGGAQAQSQAPATGTAQTPQQKPPASGTTVNPSQAPLQPVTTYPDASGKQQQPNSATGVPQAPQPKQQRTQQTEPQGAATAEKVPTEGGSAAKPAGVAIAPAKQHRTRSLLIKFGAVAAAGVAAGTIYALSRGTSSTPPGAGTPGAVPK